MVFYMYLEFEWPLCNSIENREKAEKEAEVKPDTTPEEPKPKKATKAKEKKSAKGAGFELWNELDVQRNKFMVGQNIILFFPN